MKYTKGKGFYEKGIRQCIKCKHFMRTIANRCPICGNILRTKPHSSCGRKRMLVMNPPKRY